jgi:phospholipid/cholesterol/gamma-HCH transport system substrate-binding protein
MVVNRNDRSAAIVGGLVLVATLAFAALFVVATNRSLSQNRTALWIQLPTAEGLRKGDAMLFRGVHVGEVKRIDFASDGSVLVRSMLTRSVPLTSRASARLVAADVFGRQSVVLDHGAGGRVLAAGDTLRGAPPVSLTDRIEGMARRVDRVVGDTMVDGLHALLAEANTALARLEFALRAAESALRTTEGAVIQHGQPLAAALAHSAGLAANLRAVTDSSALIPLRSSTISTMSQLDRVAARLDTASLAVLGTLTRIDAGDGTLGMLSSDPELYQRAVAALDSFEHLIRDVRENPKRYINVRVF